MTRAQITGNALQVDSNTPLNDADHVGLCLFVDFGFVEKRPPKSTFLYEKILEVYYNMEEEILDLDLSEFTSLFDGTLPSPHLFCYYSNIKERTYFINDEITDELLN